MLGDFPARVCEGLPASYCSTQLQGCMSSCSWERVFCEWMGGRCSLGMVTARLGGEGVRGEGIGTEGPVYTIV